MHAESLEADPRVTVRNEAPLNARGRCVVYWMQRAQRVTDNPALDVAIRAANTLGRPVVVFFAVVPFFARSNLRHFHFMAEALPELAAELSRRGIGFILRAFPDDVAAFAEEVEACLVVGDENPLREAEAWRRRVTEALRVSFWTVDADLVVPTALIGREHWSARTIRPHIHQHMDRFLAYGSQPRPHARWARRNVRGLDPAAKLPEWLRIDRSASPVGTFHGGPRAAHARLRTFLRERLSGYAKARNHPEIEGTSQLSPYLHFGHIGPREVARAVRDADAPEQDRLAFLEELVVRRELAAAFVRYNPAYDRLGGCEAWARRTLKKHERDRRQLIARARLEAGESPDPLWNAAQLQMVEQGWMHGYMRMYWGKRLLEWTASPEEAFEIAVELNDRYELDGRDPNGYTGIAWAIGGKHDRAWPERPIFGKVRSMTYASTSRKFDSDEYVRKVMRLQSLAG